MRVIFYALVLLCANSWAQTKNIETVFNGFYEIREGRDGEKYYSILFDSTYFKNENLQFLRILSFGSREELVKPLRIGRSYNITIQRKLEYRYGCNGHLRSIRSNRAMTDEGTLFGSDFLEERKDDAKELSCDYKVIEEYYILDIKKKKNGC